MDSGIISEDPMLKSGITIGTPPILMVTGSEAALNIDSVDDSVDDEVAVVRDLKLFLLGSILLILGLLL